MENFVYAIIVAALFAAFVVIVLEKWGITEYVQVHGNKFFSNMFRCKFCLSFWSAVIFSIFAMIITGDIELVFVPILSAPLTRFIIG